MFYPCPACGPVGDVLLGEGGTFHCLACDREVAPLLGGLLELGAGLRGRWRRSPARPGRARRGRRGRRGEVLEQLCESCGAEPTTDGKPWCGDCLLAGASPYVAELLERIAAHYCGDDDECRRQCERRLPRREWVRCEAGCGVG